METITGKYTLKELAEIKGIKLPTFRKYKERHIAELEQYHNVTITKEKVGRVYIEFFTLEPKTPELYAGIKPKKVEQIELILKALIIDKVIPTYPEIAKATQLSKDIVESTIAVMKEQGIILEPEIEIIQQIDEQTNKVLSEWKKRHCSYTYYEILEDDSKQKLWQREVHQLYGEYYAKKINEIRFRTGKYFNHGKGNGSAHQWALNCLKERFGLYKVNRKENYIIESKYKNAIKDKYVD